MVHLKRNLLLLISAGIMTACGGSSTVTTTTIYDSNETTNTLQATKSIDKIIAYANSNGTTSAPTLEDYQEAGVSGVTVENLNYVNSIIKGYDKEDVNSATKIEEVLKDRGIILEDKNPSSLSISNIITDKTTTDTTTISWSLNDYATGQIEYGTTTNYGTFSTKETSFKYKNHSQRLSGLMPDTIYHYRIHSVDKNGHESISQDKTFKTLELTNAFMLWPQAPLDDNGKPNTSQFIKEFPNTVKTLKDAGVNTILFTTNRQFFHFQKDEGLNNAYYNPKLGYYPSYFTALARIAREKNMKIVVYYNMFTHGKPSAMSQAYPELMHKGLEWKEGIDYKTITWKPKEDGYVIEHNGVTYQAKKSHTSNTDNEPGVGANWNEHWSVGYRDLSDPLNPDTQKKIQSMLDELIEAFTIDGKRPDGVHLGGDEAWSWLSFGCDDKSNCNNMNYAELYADQITKTYNFVHNKFPKMDVYIWGDMLGKYYNGGYAKTVDAINLLPKNIIIADWKYQLNPNQGFDQYSRLYKSIKEFSDAGLRVLSSGWKIPEGAKSLFWSGNILDKTKGKYEGYLTTVWHAMYWDLPNILTELKEPGSLKPTEENKNQDLDAAKDVAAAMHVVKEEMDKRECSGAGEISGTYPNCYDCNAKDGLYDGIYRDYSKSGASCQYKEVMQLTAIDGLDFSAEVALKEGAKLVYDDSLGMNVISLDAPKAYAEIPNNLEKGHKDEFSVSLWFKLNKPITSRQILISKHYTEFEIALNPNGIVYMYKSSPYGVKYEERSWRTSSKKWESNKWYHLVWSMKRKVQDIYVDNQLYPNTTFQSGVMFGDHNLTIGKRTGANVSYFDGQIADVKMFDKALDFNEVRSLSIPPNL